MLNLNQLINYVLDNYPQRMAADFRNHQFKGNQLSKLLNPGLNSINNNQLVLTEGFVSNGSAGKGNWATIPWIGLFDSEISVSAEAGFDIVYLFSADLQCVYLSLNQGWSFYKDRFKPKARLKNIQRVADYWRSNLAVQSDRITGDDIDLHAAQYQGTKLPTGYERGNILSIKYEKGSIPSDVKLMQDLLEMKSLLVSLKAQLYLPENLAYSISFILKQYNSSIAEESTGYSINKAHQNSVLKKKLKLTAGPKLKSKTSSKRVSINKPDYEKKERENSKIGFSGELLMLAYEKKQLVDANRPDLADKVQQVSETKGDGLGYDVISYSIEGEPKYIEVKTTANGINAPFYVTPNEIRISQKYQEAYELVRIYDLNGDCKFYRIIGDLSKKLRLTAQSYQAMPNFE
ncbi:hypothetical protein [Lactobacillus casei str. Zhang] [Lactiplantibacillus mudanjiangensis]|uniref:MrcB family domain-containing protein n=1 Tax=Lactiplantibacillus mudanjiangensis TaxID=1296538 RepID=UPI00101438D2|nr:DUF3578 domain-containing protein [Lactiplantibacillus mudanjiangensis]VDG31923.1 hypothetical protein [Lactobacillus casei str. Zhang] [Lactiplantibacillus mudanjiangensis]